MYPSCLCSWRQWPTSEIYICSKKFDFVLPYHSLQFPNSLSILIMSFNCLKPLLGWYHMVISIFYHVYVYLSFSWLIKLLDNSESKLDLNGILPDSAFHLLFFFFFGHNLLRGKCDGIFFPLPLLVIMFKCTIIHLSKKNRHLMEEGMRFPDNHSISFSIKTFLCLFSPACFLC